jgi:outer membrane protein TolC
MQKNCVVLLICFVLGFSAAEGQTRTLDYYLQQAAKNNPQLNDFRNQVKASSVDSLKIRAGRKPQVNMLGQILVAPVVNGYGYDNTITNSGNFELLVGVSQNVFNKNILAPYYENAHLQGQRAGNSSVQTEHELNRSITSQYINAYADILQIGFARETMKLLEDESDYLKQLVERGVYKAFDYTTFLMTKQSQEITISQQEFQFRSDLYALNLLCGIADTSRPVLTAPPVQSGSTIGISSSRFLNSFHTDSLQINNLKLMTGSNYKPKLSWFADGGVLGSQPALLYRNFGTSFGLNFSLPLYDGKKKQLEFKIIDLAENTRTSYQQFFKKQYTQEISAILTELEANNMLIAQVNKQVRLSEEQIRFGKTQLNIGALPMSDFILAVKNYKEVKNNLQVLMIRQMLLTNEFNYWNW